LPLLRGPYISRIRLAARALPVAACHERECQSERGQNQKNGPDHFHGAGLRYNRDMEEAYFGEGFIAGVIAAGARARIETLEAGVPVFYWDKTLNLDVMEEPDGRKYEIRFIPGAPRNRNYHIVRMLDRITD